MKGNALGRLLIQLVCWVAGMMEQLCDASEMFPCTWRNELKMKRRCSDRSPIGMSRTSSCLIFHPLSPYLHIYKDIYTCIYKYSYACMHVLMLNLIYAEIGSKGYGNCLVIGSWSRLLATPRYVSRL